MPGSEITEALGLVRGNAVRAKHIGRTLWPDSRTSWAVSCRPTPELMQESREQATQRMISEAEALGAGRVVAVRYTTASVANAAAEILSYGTAVKLR